MRAFVELMTISGETFPTTLATIIYCEKKCIGATIGEFDGQFADWESQNWISGWFLRIF